ncbi:LPD38 domain-containing protein [Paenibacillus sp. PDC88]|uniref:LPD38 domain-containing protein n=1 Tax=Paenibacillus sp. PDC88 TaxID=1884375 RepID=UPI000898ACC4|nr:LPD38 domain-containing protein [Paenibacillus sp. PDC88]SDW30350.1 hypothetical protein SAMN05518848_101940 [Paenibacillus sp. PDC88]
MASRHEKFIEEQRKRANSIRSGALNGTLKPTTQPSSSLTSRSDAFKQFTASNPMPAPDLKDFETLPEAMRRVGADRITESTLFQATQGDREAINEYKAATGREIKPIQGPPAPSQHQLNENAINSKARESSFANFVAPYSRAMNDLMYGNPVGNFITRLGGAAGQVATGTPSMAPGDTGNKVANIAADLIGGAVGSVTNPATIGAPGLGMLSSTNRGSDMLVNSQIGQRAINNIAKAPSKVMPADRARRLTESAAREGLAGALQGGTGAWARGEDLGSIAADTAIGAGLGVGGDLLFKGIGAGYRSVKNAFSDSGVTSNLMRKSGIPEQEINEIMALPEGRRDARMSAAASRSNVPAGVDPVVNPYTFDLPEASPSTIARGRNAAAGRSELQSIDDAVNELNNRYEQRVIDEYKYLKESRDSRAGVAQGNLQRDLNGDVIGRTGRQSNNPLWYQEFYSQNGRAPSNKDLYQLARDRVDNGFMDESGEVPSWRLESGYDEQMSGYSSARETLQNSMREIDPAVNIVDQPLVSEELKDLRPRTPRATVQEPVIEPEVPQIDPVVDQNAEPILRPDQFEEKTGLGVTPFSRVGPYDSLKTDTRSQLVSRQKREKPGLTARTDQLYTALVDDLHPLNRQDKLLESVMGEKIPANQRIHDLGLASRGADVVAKRIITDGLVDANGQYVSESLKSILSPLKAAMRKNKHIYVDFEDYLINKHAITRFDRGEKVFRDELEWTPEYGAQKVAEFERMFPEFRTISKQLYNFQTTLAQKWLVDTGMISQDMLDAWVRKNPYYVPNKRYFSELEKTGKGFGGGKKRGYGNQSNPVKSYQEGGSQRPIISPIEAIIENVDAYVKSAKRNQVMQQYVRNIQQAPNNFSPWATIVKQPEKPDDIRNIVMDEGGLEELLFRFSADFDKAMQRTQLDKDNVVRALMDGNPVHVQIKDKQLLSALTALGPEQSGKLLQMVGRLTNTVKLLTTGSNPVFTLTRNIWRDIPQSYIASKTNNNPLSFMADLIAASVDIGLKRGAYQDYLNVGGGHSSAIAADRDLLRQSKNAVLPQSGISRMHSGLRDGYENFLNAVETAPRLSEFKRVRARGGDIQEALKEAQDITTNFKRRGSLSGELDKVFLYFNAAIQGMDKTVRTYKDDPVKAIVKSVLAITVPTLALYALNHDDPDYQKLNNRTKDSFMLIPKGDGTFYKIAKPQEQGTIFSSIPERLMRQFAEEDPAAFRGFADQIRTTFFPPILSGATKSGGIPEKLLGVVGDTVFGPVADVAGNRNFADAPIVPGYLERLSPELQVDAKTTSLAKWIGEKTNSSPKQLDYLVRQYTGFIGQFGQPLLSPGGDAGYALTQQMVADPVFSNDISNEFYRYKENLDQAKTDEGAGKELPSWYDDEIRKELNRISSDMGDVRKEIRAVQAEKGMNNLLKRQKLRDLQDSINVLAAEGNRIAVAGKIPYKKK